MKQRILNEITTAGDVARRIRNLNAQGNVHPAQRLHLYLLADAVAQLAQAVQEALSE